MPDSCHSLIVVVDGLRAGWLGPYGNTWFDTPVANQLAADGVTFEECHSPGPSLLDNYLGWWRGEIRGLAARSSSQRPAPSLPALLRSAGQASLLVTDEPEVSELPDADDFRDVLLQARHDSNRTASELAATGIAQLVAGALDAMTTAASEPNGSCSWLHLRGLMGAWDAPGEIREELAVGEDCDTPSFVTPPMQAGECDPDVRFTWLLGAAAQVRVLDECLPLLLDWAERRQALFVLTSPRGYPLGEHGAAGPEEAPLHDELLHTPLIVRHPHGDQACFRVSRIAQNDTLYQLLARWHRVAPRESAKWLDEPPLAAPSSQLAVSLGKGQVAFRTAAWFARLEGDTTDLYSKPADRFEVNEVADRCSDEVRAIRELASELGLAEIVRDVEEAPTEASDGIADVDSAEPAVETEPTATANAHDSQDAHDIGTIQLPKLLWRVAR
ncbi:MAG: hypothetical protein KDB14_17115 [Planctomycetales bacterium]|nr:hypothetical protein [Planctomycetales bacterium]